MEQNEKNAELKVLVDRILESLSAHNDPNAPSDEAAPFRRLITQIADKNDCEDVLQEFAKKLLELKKRLAQAPISIDIHVSPMGYLMRVARNCAIDHIRFVMKKRELFVSVLIDEHADQRNGCDVQVEINEEQVRQRKLLEDALQKLSCKYLDVIKLDSRGLETKEIARELNITESCVSTRRSRAHEQLRRLIANTD